MNTTTARDELRHLRQAVSRLNPGERIEIDLRLCRGIPPDGFSIADWVLEGIVGSSYEFLYYENFRNRNTVFERLPQPLENDLVSYISPDRRHLFTQRPDRLFERTRK